MQAATYSPPTQVSAPTGTTRRAGEHDASASPPISKPIRTNCQRQFSFKISDGLLELPNPRRLPEITEVTRDYIRITSLYIIKIIIYIIM
jgi:hypothetical protein